jgi:hypothetical protein
MAVASGLGFGLGIISSCCGIFNAALGGAEGQDCEPANPPHSQSDSERMRIKVEPGRGGKEMTGKHRVGLRELKSPGARWAQPPWRLNAAMADTVLWSSRSDDRVCRFQAQTHTGGRRFPGISFEGFASGMIFGQGRSEKNQ